MAQTTVKQSYVSDDQRSSQKEALIELPRSLLAELFGTFALTVADAGAMVINTISGGQIPLMARAVVPGLLVMSLIYTIGNISGAHINPVVTLAFALRRAFPWRYVPAYWIVQIGGALLAAFVLRALFGRVEDLGATHAHYSLVASLVMEIILTMLLVSVILGTATRHKEIGEQAALAVGGTIALCGLFAKPISGSSMNPARSLGPALVSGAVSDVWIYVIGPALGAILATGLIRLLHGPLCEGEEEAARGSKGLSERK